MAYTRKSYVGGAPAAKLSGALNAGVLTMTLTNTTAAWSGLGGSGGTTLPFYLAIDPGLSTEEKVQVTSTDINWASGTVSITIIRGQDGTTDQYHADQAVVAPVMTATDLDEANYAVSETVGKITAAGQILYSDGVNSLAALAAGTSGYFLKSAASGAPSWGKVGNLWSGATSYTGISGYSFYLVIAQTTYVQPLSAPTAGNASLSITANGGTSTFNSWSPANNSAAVTIMGYTIVTTASSWNASISTAKPTATGTNSNTTLIVIGIA